VCSATGQVSIKVGKLTAAKAALASWSPDFDYREAAGQSHDPAAAPLAAEYATTRALAVRGAEQLRRAAKAALPCRD